MLRQLIKKLNNFIQWTKKWHFFHILFVGNFLFIAIYFLFLIFIALLDCIFNNNITAYLSIESLSFILFSIILCLAITPYTTIIATILEIFIIITKKIQKKTIQITNSFLIDNPKYNILYTVSFIYCFPLFLFVMCFYIIGYSCGFVYKIYSLFN